MADAAVARKLALPEQSKASSMSEQSRVGDRMKPLSQAVTPLARAYADALTDAERARAVLEQVPPVVGKVYVPAPCAMCHVPCWHHAAARPQPPHLALCAAHHTGHAWPHSMRTRLYTLRRT